MQALPQAYASQGNQVIPRMTRDKIEERNQGLFMKKGTMLKKWLTVLLAVILTVSLFAIPAFADEDVTEEVTEEVTGEAAADATASKGLSTGTIVSIVVGGVLVVAAVVLGIIFREKVKKFLRVYKSEIKKIVWLPWNQTRKSTVAVLIILVICAVVICLLDFGLSKGFLEFYKLF